MDNNEMVSVEEAERNVLIMTERVASLYYHTVKTLIDELGEEKAEELTRKIIDGYGRETGEKGREKVIAQGITPDIENYHHASDLPVFGWRKKLVIPEGERGTMGVVEFCPFADYWKKHGFEKWGRLYCYVDQAKYSSFNECISCTHDKNLLDGDNECIIHAVQK